MAKKKKAEPQAQEQETKLATTEAGEEQLAEAEEPSLKKADSKRYDELAQSGYRIPKAWAADEKRRQEHDEAVAKAMPSTRPDKE